MKPYLATIPVALAVLLDISFAPTASLWGARASLTLAMVVVWCVLRPRAEALTVVTAAGLLLGVLGNEPVGVALIALIPLMLLVEVADDPIVEHPLLSALVLTVIGVISYLVAREVLLAVVGARPTFALGSVRGLVITALLTTAATALLYFPVALLSGRVGANARGRRTDQPFARLGIK